MTPSWDAILKLHEVLKKAPDGLCDKDAAELVADLKIYDDHFAATAIKESLKKYIEEFKPHSETLKKLMHAFRAEWNNAKPIPACEVCGAIEYLAAKIAGQPAPASRQTFTRGQNQFILWMVRFPLQDKNVQISQFQRSQRSRPQGSPKAPKPQTPKPQTPKPKAKVASAKPASAKVASVKPASLAQLLAKI